MSRKALSPLALTAEAQASAYLDIETAFDGRITVIGVFRPGQGTRQLVGPEVTAINCLELVGAAQLLKTYNGDRFDLPVIRRVLGVDLKAIYPHRDLMFQCWKHHLKGGLKAVERQLGIERETSGFDGLQAMAAWSQWETRADREALDLLLRYNREDVELLFEVEACLLELEAKRT